MTGSGRRDGDLADLAGGEPAPVVVDDRDLVTRAPRRPIDPGRIGMIPSLFEMTRLHSVWP